MFPHPCRWLIAGTVVLVITQPVAGQETDPGTTSPADAEKTYLDLRRSDNRSTQLSAERYFNLVRLQEWSNESGTSKVMAKYVSHDPDLKSVTLATVRGSGANRVVREVTVPVAKLSKACQSRIRRIALLQPKLDELILAEKDAEENQVTEGDEYGRGYSGAAGRGEMAADQGNDGGYEGYDQRAAAGTGDEPVTAAPYGPGEQALTPEETGANDPDPLGFSELANEPPLAEAPGGFGSPTGLGEAAGPGEPRSLYDRPTPTGPLGRSQWATDYAAFHANFSTAGNEPEGAELDWGELGELRAMNMAAVEHARNSAADPYRQKISEIADRLGEVRWQASLAGVNVPERGEPEIQFDIAPLPEPLKIRFLADFSEQQAWTDLPPGQVVQFVGRFDIQTPNQIDVHVRLAN
jgi:hypothetical protein